jgi:dTDP-4-dehydrorhamnose 3,5-epimerase
MTEYKKYYISGLILLTPGRISDNRGYFSEIFRIDLFNKYVGEHKFTQGNESLSKQAGTIRGLHFQSEPHAQGKLVRCTAGALFDVAVDIRIGSPTYGQWVGETLTPENGKQLWVPPGFAHGFCSLEPNTVICYNVTDYYNAQCDKGLAWNDPAIAIRWPDIANPDTLSSKDLDLPPLSDLPDYFSWPNFIGSN